MRYKIKFHTYYNQWYVAYRVNGRRVPSNKVVEFHPHTNEYLAELFSNWFMFEENALRICNIMNQTTHTKNFNSRINEFIE